MNKAELVAAIAKSTNLTLVDTAKVLDALVEVSKKELKKGGEISLVGFLTMKTAKRAARIGRNPRTGDELKIKAKTVVTVKAGKALQDAVA